jgi:DNA-binding LacI/PurR family transcriptional regulator
MPTVVIGTPDGAGSLPAVWQDDAAAARSAVAHLTRLGHRRIARVTGPARFWHTKIRSDAFTEAAREAGAEGVCVEADYTGSRGAETTRRLLDQGEPPTAILYDNDLMAVSGLATAQSMGVEVPAALSIVAWDDSLLCELVHPPLTALSRDIPAYGACAARLLSEAAAGREVSHREVSPSQLTVRESTAPPPAGVRARPPSRGRA